MSLSMAWSSRMSAGGGLGLFGGIGGGVARLGFGGGGGGGSFGGCGGGGLGMGLGRRTGYGVRAGVGWGIRGWAGFWWWLRWRWWWRLWWGWQQSADGQSCLRYGTGRPWCWELLWGTALGPALAPMQSREAEKHTLSGLNERFSSYMGKVRALQQENAILEGGQKWGSPESSGTTTAEYEAQLGEYCSNLETLTLDTIKLEIELDNICGTSHELKAKFDFEQDVKFQLDSDISALKKYTSLKNELDFVTKMQKESKLGATAIDTSVLIIEVDTGKSFGISTALN
ncbi:unnamed protein product [Coregonus sp. 'balchen']|nr:unnamed protein product [Coregonus sp. 'balchen']